MINFKEITVRYAYVARCKECNRIIAGIADDEAHRHIIALRVGNWLLDGYIVERMSVSEAQRYVIGCECAEVEAILKRAGLR